MCVGGSSRGQADGFDIKFLEKASGVKGNGTTLLGFVAKKLKAKDDNVTQIEKKYPVENHAHNTLQGK